MLRVLVLLGLLASAATAAPTPDQLVDRWLAAQNAGKFDAYQALYAKRFHGIRRSGDTTVRLDRDGWLRDRRKMFAHPMKVAIDNRVVDATGGRIRVRFTQTFEQGTYRDTGTKELVIVGDRIVSEVMLASVIAGADGSTCDEMLCAKTSAPAAIVATCERQCTAGTAPSCRELAVIHDLGACKVPRDAAKAKGYYAAACGPDDAMACTAAASGEPAARAEPLLAKACEAGDPAGCFELAHRVQARNPARAIELLETACDEYPRSGPGETACGELVEIFRAQKNTALREEYERKYKDSQGGE